MTPPSPNNDDDGLFASPNLVQVLQKNYVAIGPVDLQFDVINSGGITEYRISEGVANSTPLAWSGYRLELGFGHGAGFTLSTAGDGLDFDAPELNSGVSFGAFFPTVVASEDVLTASGGIIPAFSYAGGFVFHIDVPDGISSFTIRQRPIGVPEPSTWILAALGLMALCGFQRGWSGTKA